MKALVVSERLLADLGVMDGVKRQGSWMYTLMIILSCTGIAFLSRMWLEKSREAAVLQLTADAREVAQQALGISAKPMLGQAEESVPMSRMEVEEQMSILDS